MPTTLSNIVQQLFRALCAVNAQHDNQAGKLPCGWILKFSSALGSFLSALTPPAEAKSHNNSASGDSWALPSFFLCLYLNSPLSGRAAARICQQQVALLSWQSRGDGVLAKGHGAHLFFATNSSSAKVNRAEPSQSWASPTPPKLSAHYLREWRAFVRQKEKTMRCCRTMRSQTGLPRLGRTGRSFGGVGFQFTIKDVITEPLRQYDIH